MKKTFTLILLSTIFVLRTFADSGGPDLWGYTWKDSNEPGGPVYSWIDITGENATEVKLLQDDNIRGPFQLNFDFHYYWYDVSEFYVGSNGYISFQYGNLASPFPSNYSTTPPNDLIGAFMNDLTFAGTNDFAECYYWVSQDADTLIVSYVNVPYFDTTPDGWSGNNTFQIILSKIDNSITFQYKEVTPFSTYSGASIVGIENYAGNIGLFWTDPFIQPPPANYAIKYYYPANPTLTVEDAYMLYNDNPETGAVFVPGNGGVPHDLTAMIKNGGNATLNPFNIQGLVKDPNNNQVVSEFYLTDTLAPAETNLFTFTQQLNPAIYGTYNFITISQLPGDDVNSNNAKNQELVVIDTSQSEILLSYNGNQNSSFAVNWVGDQGGVGTHFIPPFYPVQVTKLHYWITGNYSAASMSGRIFDDDGVSGLPFTLYDSVFLGPTQIVTNGWTDVELPDPVVVTSGGFYVSWDMQGAGITLGNTATPVSNRSYEVFENGWGVYRYRSDYDPMITVTITPYSFPTGVENAEQQPLQMVAFPNPASDVVTVSYAAATKESVWLVITDLQGKMLSRWNLGKSQSGTNQFTFDATGYSPGMYLMKLYSGKEEKMQKLVIAD